jgi:FkbM family methyltransferase
MVDAIQTALELVQSIITDRSNRNERSRRVAAFVGWQFWKRFIRRPLIVKLFNGYRFMAYPNDDIASSIIYYRIPDYAEISFLRQHINNGTLIDVGANVGSFTLLLADRIQHAILFEPNPLAAERARQNIALNHLGFQVIVQALSDTEGEIAFEDRGGTSSLNRTVTETVKTTFPVRRVNRTTLDAFLAQCSFPAPISLVKIDVEGHENAVIRGMQNCLKAWRPLVMFEYLQRTNLDETQTLFQAAEYIIAEIVDGYLRIAEQPVT